MADVEGHEVKTATTAEDAIDFGTHWLPSVLVADWMLTSPLDGLQVSQAMGAANPQLQTILITGYPSQELKARAEQANVFSFIEKPFSLTEVAGAVRRAANVGRTAFAGHIFSFPLANDHRLARDACGCRLAQPIPLAARTPGALAKTRGAIAILSVAPDIDFGDLADGFAGAPDLIVIGSSEADDGQQFVELGIDRFLPRFWDVDDLHAVLIQPIVECIECGLPPPLAWGRAQGDPVSRWECRMCGGYQAVMLKELRPAALQRNVRAATR